jgi:hypothetical protein
MFEEKGGVREVTKWDWKDASKSRGTLILQFPRVSLSPDLPLPASPCRRVSKPLPGQECILVRF